MNIHSQFASLAQGWPVKVLLRAALQFYLFRVVFPAYEGKAEGAIITFRTITTGGSSAQVV